MVLFNVSVCMYVHVYVCIIKYYVCMYITLWNTINVNDQRSYLLYVTPFTYSTQRPCGMLDLPIYSTQQGGCLNKRPTYTTASVLKEKAKLHQQASTACFSTPIYHSYFISVSPNDLFQPKLVQY